MPVTTTVRRGAAAAVAALALALVAGLLAVATSPASAATGTFRVGQLNILKTMSYENFLHDLEIVTSRSDVVTLNEVEGRKTAPARWAENHGWHLYQPGVEGTQQAEVALLARKSMFTVTEKQSVFAVDTNPSEPPPPRWINWVEYEHRGTGMDLSVIATHANAGIDDAGRPTPLPRTTDAEKHFRLLRDIAAQRAAVGQVVVTGDLNVDFEDDRRVQHTGFPYVVLDERDDPTRLPGLRSSFALHGLKGNGTHGNRHIDYVYLWQRVPGNRVLTMTDYGIFEGPVSDHDAIVGAFRIDLP